MLLPLVKTKLFWVHVIRLAPLMVANGGIIFCSIEITVVVLQVLDGSVSLNVKLPISVCVGAVGMQATEMVGDCTCTVGDAIAQSGNI